MSTGEFCVDGGIPCQWGNSVSMGEFRVDGGIPYQRNSVEKTLKRVFYCFFFFFNNVLAD